MTKWLPKVNKRGSAFIEKQRPPPSLSPVFPFHSAPLPCLSPEPFVVSKSSHAQSDVHLFLISFTESRGSVGPQWMKTAPDVNIEADEKEWKRFLFFTKKKRSWTQRPFRDRTASGSATMQAEALKAAHTSRSVCYTPAFIVYIPLSLSLPHEKDTFFFIFTRSHASPASRNAYTQNPTSTTSHQIPFSSSHPPRSD